MSAEGLTPFLKNPDALVPFLAKTLLPPGFDGIILLAAISAALSTMSAIVLVTTTSLTSDILRYLHPEISDKRMLLRTRVVGVMILLIAAVSAAGVPRQIVPLVSVSMGVIRCVLVPLYLRPLLEERHTNRICRQPAGLFPFDSGLELLWQSAHPPRLHRPPLRRGGLCGGKPGDEPD